MGRELAFFESGEQIGSAETAQAILDLIDEGERQSRHPFAIVETVKTLCKKKLEDFVQS